MNRAVGEGQSRVVRLREAKILCDAALRFDSFPILLLYCRFFTSLSQLVWQKAFTNKCYYFFLFILNTFFRL